ncbi:MAG: hypothetical protein ABJH28_09250 [Paraglaciecola sp.]|uniref:hypothetical protein n=1 Tax=Paraglaciecola sp. TaxID=1920173 RepID=UPI0032664EF3
MKIIYLIILILMPVFGAQAGSCGAGKITRILIGAYNLDDLILQIDYSEGTSSHAGSDYNGYIRYQKSQLGEYRSNMLLSLALSAYHSGSIIYTSSHNSNCSAATEISLRVN